MNEHILDMRPTWPDDEYPTAPPLRGRTDADLLLLARSGQENAMAELYHRYIREAGRYARRFSTTVDSEDIAADCLVSTFAAIRAGRGPQDSFRPYLYRAIRNRIITRIDAESREQPADFQDDDTVGRLLGPADSPTADPQLHAPERDALRTVFSALPHRWRYILWAIEVEGHRPADLSAELGLSAGSVAALIYRARLGLRTAYLRLAEPTSEQPMPTADAR